MNRLTSSESRLRLDRRYARRSARLLDQLGHKTQADAVRRLIRSHKELLDDFLQVEGEVEFLRETFADELSAMEEA
jgi:hypothetical protein